MFNILFLGIMKHVISICLELVHECFIRIVGYVLIAGCKLAEKMSENFPVLPRDYFSSYQSRTC